MAGLLLEWLSELPEPVIHPSLYAEMLMTQTEASEAEQLNRVQQLLKQVCPRLLSGSPRMLVVAFTTSSAAQ